MIRSQLFPALLGLLLASGAQATTEFHVATTGDDAHRGTARKPFQTLERARDAVRALKQREGADIVIHGGTYVLKQALTLTPADSGTSNQPVRYIAAKGETPIITSARAIKGWQPLAKHGDAGVTTNLWVADVPKGWRFHFLYADGKSLPVARLHKTDRWQDWSRFTTIGPVEPGGQLLGVPKGQLDDLPDNGDVEMNLLPIRFWNTISVVRDFDRAASTLRRHSKNPTVCEVRDQFICNGGNYNLLNARKFITQPGEWCVDSAAGKVYLWPANGDPNTNAIWAPTLYRLVELKGDGLGRTTVHDVQFQGLTFACTDRLPEDQWPDEWLKRSAELPDAMMWFEGASNCVIERCTFAHSGSYGVALQNYAQGIRILGNEIAYPGCGGVLLQGYGPGTTDVNKNNVIRRNYIHHTGNGGYLHSAAVTLYQSGGNDITLNWIDNVPYAAVMIGGCLWNQFSTGNEAKVWDSYGNSEALYKPRWEELPKGHSNTFSRAEFKAYLFSGNNRVRRNIVTNYMTTLHDGGALYAWGCGNGNVWQSNLLRRDKAKPDDDLCLALYMDDGVDEATIKDNVCWHVGGSTINKGTNRWENNTITPQKPDGYDARLADIVAEAEREGGWLARPAQEAQ